MKEEKENRQSEDIENEVSEAEIDFEAETDEEAKELIEDKYTNLKNELERKEKQIAEYVDSLQRLKAEFENYKKRMLREQTSFMELASEDMILKLLPVLDNFERAIVMTGDNEEHKGIIKGLEMVYSELLGVLEKEGLSTVTTEGQFDPALHEAVMQVEEEGYEENAIVDVLREGYRLKNKLIRPAMVKVAKK